MASPQTLSVSRWRSRQNRGASSLSTSATQPTQPVATWKAEAPSFPSSYSEAKAEKIRRSSHEQESGPYMALQHDRAMAEVTRLLEALEQAKEREAELEAETKRGRHEVQKLTDQLNQSQLVNLQLKFEQEKAGNVHNAEKWAAAALEDELMQLRASNSEQKQALKEQQIEQLKLKIEKLNKVCWAHEEAALALKKRFGEMCMENARLQASTSAPDWSSAYGERDYIVMPESVQYCATPNLTDVNTAAAAVPQGQIVTGTGLLQGPRAIFILCKSGNGYLPILSAEGKELLRHKGCFGGEHLEHNEDGTLKNQPN